MDQDLTLYHYDDTDAPELGGSDPESQRVELLHAILIDGYGDKSEAGWEEISKSHDDEDRMVHFCARQPYGNGIYVRVERGKDIVAARDVENDGEQEEDLIDTFRAGLDDDGYRAPEHKRWVALAGERTFYLCYALTSSGEPSSGTDGEPAAILEGFADFDDLMAHEDAGTGYLIGGASARTQFLARYGARKASEDATDCSAAIEGYPDRWSPHYASITAPLGNRYLDSEDAARLSRLSQNSLISNRVIMDRALVRDGDDTVRGYLPNVRILLTGFASDPEGYEPDDWPRLGDQIEVDGQSYRFAFAGAEGNDRNGAPNSTLILFRE